MKAGQSFEFASRQYETRSSNLWYQATFRIDAAVDGTAQVENGPDPWFKLFGASFYVPWSTTRTTLTYVPEKKP